MHREHQDKIKEDQSDLKNLSAHLQKVEKLKLQYTQQKQEIGSLKNVIMELKSENQDLKSQSFVNEKSQKGRKKQKAETFSNSDEQNLDKNINKVAKNRRKYKQNKLKSQSKDPQNDYEADHEERKTKPKIWNNDQNKGKKQMRQKFNQKYNQYQDVDQQLHPGMSIRDYSGYLSSTYTGRLLSPQARTQYYQGSWRGKKNFNHTQYGDRFDGYEVKLDSNYLSIKNKLVDNLVADLNFQLQEKEEQISHQQSNHKQTKKTLKKTLNQNQKLSEMNNKLFSSYELLEKENEFLKQQLMKQTQSKYKAESINQDFILWHNTVMKRCHEQFELQFLAMDAIYYQFQRICNSKIYS